MPSRLVLLLLLVVAGHALLVPPRLFSSHSSLRSPPPSLSEGPSSSSITPFGSKFDDAFSSLAPAERYNAVLDSLLSKGGSAEAAGKAVELVNEMTGRRLPLSADAAKTLFDVSARPDNLPLFLTALSAARENGACRAFGSAKLSPRPSGPSSNAAMPEDSRGAEVAAALSFCVVVGSLLVVEFIDALDWILPGETEAPPLIAIFLGFGALWAVDRYTQGGEYVALISRGLSRLFERDLARESTVESASFLTGYVLGLPTCAFMPTAVRPLDLIASSSEEMSKLLGPQPRLIDRMLIWLMAPVVAEQTAYGGIIISRPGLALEMLQAARRREASLGIDVQQGGWTREEDEARVRWAFTEAKKLLSSYGGVREALTEQMTIGSSVGGSVQLVENRLKSRWGAI